MIIYTTKHGSVGRAANILKSKIEGQVTLVNIMQEKAPSIEEYDYIILGGSIYAGKIQRKLSKFIASHLPLLLSKKVGLFICAAEQRVEEKEKELINAFPIELSQHALCKEIFGYEIHYEDMNFLEKKIISSVMGYQESQFKLSEEKIENFAKTVIGK